MKYYQNEYFCRICGAIFYRTLEKYDSEYAFLRVVSEYGYQWPKITYSKLIKTTEEKHIDLLSYRMVINIIKEYFRDSEYQLKGRRLGKKVKVVNVCNLLTWEEKSYKDGVPAIVVDVEQNESEKRYLCEFENKERKWIAEDRIRKVYEDA